jgi:hypothetical protein
MANASGVFKKDDVVYQGPSPHTANAKGTVITYSRTLNKLILGAVEGQFKVNNYIHAVSTNGTCQIASFDTTPTLLAGIQIQPNPYDAQPEDDYGYNINIIEFPEVEHFVYTSDSENVTADIITITADRE